MKVSVHHDAVADTVAQLALAVRAFEVELDSLDAEVSRLQSAWNGESQLAYERAQAEWSRSIRATKGLLADATTRLITANSISLETASRATGIWA